MEEHVYKLIELTGTSKQSLEGAINNAITKAAKSVRNMRWFQVVETRGAVENGNVALWQVTLKIGFELDE